MGAAWAAWQWAGGPARDIGLRLDLVEDGPLQLRLGGPLWRGRTERDEEGAPDLAYVRSGAPLAVAVTGRDGRRPTSVAVALDGRTVAHRRLCPTATCRPTERVTVTPAATVRGRGPHRVTVVARASGRNAVVRTTFEVTIGSAPRVREGEPVARSATGRPPPAVTSAQRRRTLRVLGRERRAGVLRGVLGGSPYAITEIGRLNRGTRQVGTTVLVSLRRPRIRVRARVPAYVSDPRAASGFRERPLTLSAPILRDLMIDVALTPRPRVIAVQPGPRSRTDRRQQAAGKTPVESPADTSLADPQLVRLSDRGPAFLTYDGTPVLGRAARDWPVSLVFTGRARIPKVKRALRKLGFVRPGRTSYLAYREVGAGLRFDGDHGLKTTCDRQGSDLHVRLYAPSATDRLIDPEFGDVVVATAHIDRGDSCSPPPQLFGFSERAEERIAALAANRLGWRVKPDHLALGNVEPYRRDIADIAHVWSSDGRATVIDVP